MGTAGIIRVATGWVSALTLLGAVVAQGAENASATARRILGETGVQGGVIVHLGCGDGKLTAALRAGDGFLVHGLDGDATNVEKARAHIREAGVYGTVSAELFAGCVLPYTNNLVNLLVAEDLEDVPMENIVAYIEEVRRMAGMK